jgi:hypothetical protein
MIYNQTRMNGVPMPLLMGCTKPTAIETIECETKVIYNPVLQIVEIDCGVVGTKSLKTTHFVAKNSAGGRVGKTDNKNEIDDRKTVK